MSVATQAFPAPDEVGCKSLRSHGEIVWVQTHPSFPFWPACVVDPHFLPPDTQSLATAALSRASPRMRKQSVYMYASAHFDFALPSQMKDYVAERGVFANQEAVGSFAQLLPQAVALADKELCLQPEERLSWVLQSNKPNLIAEDEQTINSEKSDDCHIDPSSIVTESQSAAAQETLEFTTSASTSAVDGRVLPASNVAVISISEDEENEPCEVVETDDNAVDNKSIEQSSSCPAINLGVSASLGCKVAASSEELSNEATNCMEAQIDDHAIEWHAEGESHLEGDKLDEPDTIEPDFSATGTNDDYNDDDKARGSAINVTDCNADSADAERLSNPLEGGSEPEPVEHVFTDIQVSLNPVLYTIVYSV